MTFFHFSSHLCTDKSTKENINTHIITYSIITLRTAAFSGVYISKHYDRTFPFSVTGFFTDTNQNLTSVLSLSFLSKNLFSLHRPNDFPAIKLHSHRTAVRENLKGIPWRKLPASLVSPN